MCIAWYCMVLYGIVWYCMVLYGIVWLCMVLQSITNSTSLHGFFCKSFIITLYCTSFSLHCQWMTSPPIQGPCHYFFAAFNIHIIYIWLTLLFLFFVAPFPKSAWLLYCTNVSLLHDPCHHLNKVLGRCLVWLCALFHSTTFSLFCTQALFIALIFPPAISMDDFSLPGPLSLSLERCFVSSYCFLFFCT